MIHSQFGQGDLSRSKCCPCTEQDCRPRRAARSCPAGARTSFRHRHSQRKGWEKPFLFGGGEERFPRRPSCLFCQILQNSFLGFAEKSCDSRNHQSDPRSHSGWRECAQETHLSCPVFVRAMGTKIPSNWWATGCLESLVCTPLPEGSIWGTKRGETTETMANTVWDGSEVDFAEVPSAWLSFVCPWEC